MAKAKAQAAEGGTKVRVLAVCLHGNPNDIAVLDGQALKGALADGSVDDHPDAVAYAESLAPKAEAEAAHEE